MAMFFVLFYLKKKNLGGKMQKKVKIITTRAYKEEGVQ